MAKDLPQFLGTGWSFPPSFKKESKTVNLVSDFEDIQQSLRILLSTSVRERVMQPLYGCNLNDLLFEPVNLTLITTMRGMIKNAIVYFEPRIKLIDLDLEADNLEGKIDITINYQVRGTNSRFNFVYPFYLEEGTNVAK